jgi:Raf kinase inhibitor-like YbhB/YbcL family protein
MGLGIVGCEYDGKFEPSKSDNLEQVQVNENSSLPPAGEASPTQVIALSQPATETMDWLKVDSPAFPHNQAIPDRFADSNRIEMPALKWSDVPHGTKSFAVIVEDPDAQNPRPFVHLIAYNIPANHRELSNNDISRKSDDLIIGRNSSDSMGFVPFAPPMGQKHTYHFQVFALDTKLDLASGADKNSLLDAMNGHVLAKGETVGTYHQK